MTNFNLFQTDSVRTNPVQTGQEMDTQDVEQLEPLRTGQEVVDIEDEYPKPGYNYWRPNQQNTYISLDTQGATNYYIPQENQYPESINTDYVPVNQVPSNNFQPLGNQVGIFKKFI